MLLIIKVVMVFNSELYPRSQQLVAQLLLMLSTYFAPIKEITIALLVLISLDLFTGLWKVIKLEGIRAIDLNRLRDTFSKVIQYSLAIVAVFLLEHGILDTDLGLTRVIVAAMAVVEIISISKNLFSISGNDIFLKLTNTLKKRFNNVLKLKL